MTYTAKLFGGPAHGCVYDVANDMRDIVIYSWVDPIMPYKEWEKLESHTIETRYIRHYTLVKRDRTPHIGYFFHEDANEEFIIGIMNMEFAHTTPLVFDKEVKINHGKSS